MYERALAWVTLSLVAACTSSGDDRGTSPLDGSSSGAAGNAGSSAASGGSGGARSNGGSSPGGAGPANGGASSGGSSNGGAGLGGAATGGIPNPGGTPGSGGMPSTGGADAGSPSTTRVLYVGTGDGAVLVYEADTTTWALTRRDRTAAGDVLSFLAQSPDRRTLYATDEGAGMVRSFRIDASGLLTVLPAQTSNGHPTHVAAHPTGRFVLVAHYNEGRVEVFGTATSGAATAAVDEDASGSQAHQAVVSPDGRFVFVPNKGSNTISQYLFDSATGALSPNTPPSVASEAGAGPRHLAFAPNGRYAYVIDELGSRVEAFGYDTATGTLARFQAEDSLPAGFAGTSTGAEIAVSPSGRFLYCSNRIGGADGDIAIFAIGASDGRLSLVGHESTRGRTPRHFSLDPTGEALFVANQTSQEVVVFRIDPTTGRLTFATETNVGEDAFFVGAFAAP